MEVKTTQRGFAYAEFTDELNNDCSIQTSSNTTHKLWLGVENSRMLLTQKQVAELLPLLQKFVETGEIV